MQWLWHLNQYYLNNWSYFRVSHKSSLKVTLDCSKRHISGPAKWISNWRGHGTLKRNVNYHDWSTRMAKIVVFWPWWQPFDSFALKVSLFLLFYLIFFATKKKRGWPWPPPALYSEICQTSEMDLFPKINNDSKSFFIFAKSFILDIWECFEYASGEKMHLTCDQTEAFTKSILL